jgi:Ribbon-helix-helix protein, copG family
VREDRYAFKFTKETTDRISDMMRLSGKPSVGELIREALRLYEWVIAEREAGNLIGSLNHERHFTAIIE